MLPDVGLQTQPRDQVSADGDVLERQRAPVVLGPFHLVPLPEAGPPGGPPERLDDDVRVGRGRLGGQVLEIDVQQVDAAARGVPDHSE